MPPDGGQYLPMDLRAQRRYIAAEVRAEMARQSKRHGDAADALGISKSATSKKIHAERGFRTDELLKLAHFLGVPVTNFLPEPSEVAS